MAVKRGVGVVGQQDKEILKIKEVTYKDVKVELGENSAVTPGSNRWRGWTANLRREEGMAAK